MLHKEDTAADVSLASFSHVRGHIHLQIAREGGGGGGGGVAAWDDVNVNWLTGSGCR